MRSQLFKNLTTGEIVDQIPLSDIANYVEYNGPLAAGSIDDNELLFGIDEEGEQQ